MPERVRACRWCIHCDENSDGHFGEDVEAVCLVGKSVVLMKNTDLDVATECKSWCLDSIFCECKGR